jgi:hypothetical protein
MPDDMARAQAAILGYLRTACTSVNLSLFFVSISLRLDLELDEAGRTSLMTPILGRIFACVLDMMAATRRLLV